MDSEFLPKGFEQFNSNLTPGERHHLKQSMVEYLAKLKVRQGEDGYELMDKLIKMWSA